MCIRLRESNAVTQILSLWVAMWKPNCFPLGALRNDLHLLGMGQQHWSQLSYTSLHLMGIRKVVVGVFTACLAGVRRDICSICKHVEYYFYACSSMITLSCVPKHGGQCQGVLQKQSWEVDVMLLGEWRAWEGREKGIGATFQGKE